MNLQNATALITGGSSGIGFAIAKVFVDAGARVAITGRDEKKLYKAAETLSAVPIRADVSNENDVMRTYREVLQAFDHLAAKLQNISSSGTAATLSISVRPPACGAPLTGRPTTRASLRYEA